MDGWAANASFAANFRMTKKKAKIKQAIEGLEKRKKKKRGSQSRKHPAVSSRIVNFKKLNDVASHPPHVSILSVTGKYYNSHSLARQFKPKPTSIRYYKSPPSLHPALSLSLHFLCRNI